MDKKRLEDITAILNGSQVSLKTAMQCAHELLEAYTNLRALVNAQVAAQEHFEKTGVVKPGIPIFDVAAQQAEVALSIAESGRMRPKPLVHEGPRAYPIDPNFGDNHNR